MDDSTVKDSVRKVSNLRKEVGRSSLRMISTSAEKCVATEAGESLFYNGDGRERKKRTEKRHFTYSTGEREALNG